MLFCRIRERSTNAWMCRGGCERSVEIGIEMYNLAGDARIKRDFHPHVTLLYDGDAIPRTNLTEPVTIAANEFALIRNRAGAGAHECIGR